MSEKKEYCVEAVERITHRIVIEATSEESALDIAEATFLTTYLQDWECIKIDALTEYYINQAG